MQDDPDLPDESWLTDEQWPQWEADRLALAIQHRDLLLHPLHLGDLFNELKARWGEHKLPLLFRLAGVPYLVAKRRARVAAAIPPDHTIRNARLPFSILRLLAPLPNPLFWAAEARLLQQAGTLTVRDFARLLEDAGLRRRRRRRIPRCLHCGCEVPDTSERVFLRRGATTGWLCSTACTRAFFTTPEPPDPSHPSDPSDTQHPTPNTQYPTPNPRDTESQSPRYRPVATTRSRSPRWGGRPRPGAPRRPPLSHSRSPPPRSRTPR